MTRHIGDYNFGEELIEVRHESSAANCAKLARESRAIFWLFLVQIDFCEEKKYRIA